MAMEDSVTVSMSAEMSGMDRQRVSERWVSRLVCLGRISEYWVARETSS